MILVVISLILWMLLLWLGQFGPRVTVPVSKRGGGGGGGGEVTTNYFYKIKFAHGNIDPSQPIYLYDALNNLIQTVPPYYSNMDYGTGVIDVPGSQQNTLIESLSTATYNVLYSSGDLVIDYENAHFKISKTIVRNPAMSTVRGTFEYVTVFTPINDITAIIDGKWSTQVQTEFYSEPIKGYQYGILDFGSEKEIQAFDIIGGFFKPDGDRKYDIGANLTIKYSLNGVDFFNVGEKTTNFQLEGGKSVSFEEKDLGVGFKARYLLLVIESVKKLDWHEGIWVLAITEVAAYTDIVIKSQCTLIPLAYTTAECTGASTTILVDNTDGFTEPESAEENTAYVINEDGTSQSFTYTGLTATSFTGVTWSSGASTYAIDSTIVSAIEGDNTLYDHYQLLPKLGDRFYKKSKIDDTTLFSKTQLDYLSKAYLKEYVKNHSKIQVEVLYSPHLQVGQTIKVVDTYNATDFNYFIESITDNNGACSLTLARYP